MAVTVYLRSTNPTAANEEVTNTTADSWTVGVGGALDLMAAEATVAVFAGGAWLYAEITAQP